MNIYTFNEMFDHTASSPMTMMDVDGYIKYATHNVIPYSSVDQWNNNGTNNIITLGQLDPLGGNDAIRVQFSQSSGTFLQYNGIKPDTGKYIFKCWIRATSGTTLVNITNEGTLGVPIFFDERWRLVSLPISSESNIIRINNNNVSGEDRYASDFLIWGVSVIRADLQMLPNPDADKNTSNTAFFIPDKIEQLNKIIASDGNIADLFGYSVAIGDGRIVVGAHREDEKGTDSGSAYIFDLDGNQIDKITAGDGASGDYFGWSVAVGDGRIVVGAYRDDDNGSDSGSAYIFDLDGNQIDKINASDGVSNDRFGYSVAIGDGRIVVSAYLDDDNGTDSGSAYIFDLDGNQITKITASDGAGSDYFGRSVAVGDGRIVVGAFGDDNEKGTDSGSAYIFDLNIIPPPENSPFNEYLPTNGLSISLPRRNNYRYNANTSSYEPDGLLIETESRTNYFQDLNPQEFLNFYNEVNATANTSLGPPFDLCYLISNPSSGRRRMTGYVSSDGTSDYKTVTFHYRKIPETQNPYIHFFINGGSVDYQFGICINTLTDEMTQGYADGTIARKFPVYYEIFDVGNDWRKVIITSEIPGTNPYIEFYFCSIATNSNSSIEGDACYVAAFQYEEGFGASSFIPTNGSNLTRNGEEIKFSNNISNTVSFYKSTTINVSGKLRYIEEANNVSTVGLFEWYSDANNYIAAVLNTQDGTGGYDFHVKYQGTEHVLESANRNVETEGNLVEFNVIQSIDGLQKQLDASVEGSLEANVSISGIFNLDPIDFYIGAENSFNASFNGSLNELRIWEIVLNDDEMINESTEDSFLFFDDGNNIVNWITVGAEAIQSVGFGNPTPSYSVDASGYMYRDTGVTDLTNKIIEFDVYSSTDTTTNSLCNFFFGCDSSGNGLAFRIEARSTYSSFIRSVAGFDNSFVQSGTTRVTFSEKTILPDTWVRMKISIDDNLNATFYADDVEWGSLDITPYVQGGYICLQSGGDDVDISTSYWDNIEITYK